jgi:hypothetical protein
MITSGQSTVQFDSLCSGPRSRTCLNQKNGLGSICYVISRQKKFFRKFFKNIFFSEKSHFLFQFLFFINPELLTQFSGKRIIQKSR